MADPIEYRIVRNLQTALRGISSAGGYHHDVAALAVKLDANSSVEDLIGDSALRPFFILELPPDVFAEYQGAKRLRILMPFVVHAVTDSDATVDEDWVKTFYELCADVEQAMAVDITRGGLATDTRVLKREFQTYNGRQVWAMVNGEIRVPRVFGLPNG